MREIEKDMVRWLDEKLVENGLAQLAIKNKDARTLFRLAAECCVGIKESSHNAGPMVELIQKTVGGADKEPWCMGFVQTCLAYAEKKTGIKSPVAVSEHCLTVWNNTPKNMRVKNIPAPGAIIIWRHGTTQAGHTGLVLGWQSSKMDTVEGNTGSGNMREGDGVYFKNRSTTANGKMKVVGFLKPF
jgi:hypothetical protein